MSDLNNNIVVVDDDAGMNQAIERLLNAAGFGTVTFPSAEAFLKTDAAQHASCLILDIHLPGLSGFELHRRLSQSGADLPVIFISAFDDADAQAQARTAGAYGYFTKPFPGKLLLEAISEALQIKK